MTLEINATDTAELYAINETLAHEQNRTLRIKGYDNNQSFYIYNIPLIAGTNEINDQSNSDGNFTVTLSSEGRYRPRVTIETTDGLLYSSGAYALSLDVKADANQKDPKGAEPMDVAKEFVNAIIGDDREMVERLTGGNPYIAALLYGNEKSIPLLKDI